MEHFTPWSALSGGVLIGLAAALMLWFDGRIAGISGIVGELLVPGSPRKGWRWAFLGGLLAGAVVLRLALPGHLGVQPTRTWPAVVLAGLLVGFGTRMGNGCTSGHGVCGIPRGSIRSIAATLTFIGTGALTVGLIGLLGGSL